MINRFLALSDIVEGFWDGSRQGCHLQELLLASGPLMHQKLAALPSAAGISRCNAPLAPSATWMIASSTLRPLQYPVLHAKLLAQSSCKA